MKKLLATALFSAMVILPSYSAEQESVKYELGEYNFSFDKQEEIQKTENNKPEKATIPQELPSLQDDKATILPIVKEEKAVVDINIKPVSKSIEIQKQVVKQIKEEEQTEKAESEEEISNSQSEIPQLKQEQNSIIEPDNLKTIPDYSEENKDEIQTPVPQSSVMPSKDDLKLKTNVKPHTPMPTQKVLDESHATSSEDLTPVKRVVQPTKPPAKEPQKPKITEEDFMDEFTLKGDEKTDAVKADTKNQTVENSEQSTVEKTNDVGKKEEQKVKEKKKLPFSFELQKMQYSGADSRQL